MRIALAQITSTNNLQHNLDTATLLTQQAADQGATWILFPENTPFYGSTPEKLAVAQTTDGSIIQHYRNLAQEHHLWITVGSFIESSPLPDKTYNTLVLIDPDGNVHQTYRKVHLFDARTSVTSYAESDATIPGSQVTITTVTIDNTPIKVGLSICYDLRFPELYRSLRHLGAEILLIPAAFTLETGRDHWHPLLQARAIENQCYVLAPNQFGHHFSNRYSFGRSSVYDPWGTLTACAPDSVGITIASIDLEHLHDIRSKMPVESHRSPLTSPPHPS